MVSLDDRLLLSILFETIFCSHGFLYLLQDTPEPKPRSRDRPSHDARHMSDRPRRLSSDKQANKHYDKRRSREKQDDRLHSISTIGRNGTYDSHMTYDSHAGKGLRAWISGGGELQPIGHDTNPSNRFWKGLIISSAYQLLIVIFTFMITIFELSVKFHSIATLILTLKASQY